MPTRILFVEDNVNTARAMKVMLELKGFAVTVAGTVAEAATALETGSNDLIISDLNLPDGSGIEVIKNAVGIPSIALSGSISSSDREASIAGGFHEYITKPFDLQELLAVIKKLT